MGFQFGNPIVGGVKLIRPAIQSPNYAAGTTGWTVNADGSVEFNNGIFRGFIVGGSLFIYTGVPGLGNPPVSWITSATADPFGNTLTPGIFLAAAAGSGNGMAGLLWNSVVGTNPLLAIFPDSTVGFTGHSPFVTAQVFNRGAANEYLSLSLGGGAGSGGSSPVMLNLFSVSKDGTIHAHATLYGGASGNQMADFTETGLTVVNQLEGNTYRAGHLNLSGTMTPASPQTINTTGNTTLNGLGPVNIAAGTYRIFAHVQFAGNQAAGSPTISIVLAGGAVLSTQYGTGLYFPSGGTTVGTNARTGSLGFTGPVMITTESGVLIFAKIKLTTGGTIALAGSTNVAADTYAVHNAELEIIPV